jgi:hypothetical protein
MATYPIKMLKDEEGKAFVPLISIDSVQNTEGKNINELLETKLETKNIKAGSQISIKTEGNNVIISNSSEGMQLIDNLDANVSGLGALDARQGKVLKESIPEIVNNLTTIDSNKALSAHQGYVLAGRVAPTGGAAGQVLKKASDSDYSFEWGDAADPNAIGGDGTIKKIVELSYQDYLDLKDNGQLDEATEYHINDWTESGYSEIKAEQVIMSDGFDVEEVIRDDQGHIVNLSNRMDAVEGRLENKDIVDDGQNTRLDVAEGNIDAVVGAVNNISNQLSSMKYVETAYLGSNPDIDSYHAKPGIYGIYNCSKTPINSIGVLEVLYYSWDWTIQRFSSIDYGGSTHMWERSFYSGTTWTAWTQRW